MTDSTDNARVHPSDFEQLAARVTQLEMALPKMVPMSALEILARDPHRFSTRGCETCRNISTVIGKPWGCIALARETKS